MFIVNDVHKKAILSVTESLYENIDVLVEEIFNPQNKSSFEHIRKWSKDCIEFFLTYRGMSVRLTVTLDAGKPVTLKIDRYGDIVCFDRYGEAACVLSDRQSELVSVACRYEHLYF